MKMTKPIDNILNSTIKTKILRFFCRTDADWNGRQIAREIGVTPKSAHMALNALNREKILILRNVGKTHVYSLNANNFLVSKLLKPLFSKENAILDSIIRIIKRKISTSTARKDILSVAIFGSVSKHADHPSSDIDLAVILKNATARPAVERLFEEIDDRILKEFSNVVSPYINTKIEFDSKYEKGLPIVKNILRSYKLIYGERLEKLI
ncbi:MAG: nucleotidyltransferase domain-containing protein [Candidatus Omnitrophica bacterium]|nr:nucleotidyltransferase domain-containing protein [Candidatus Omnitrophota bacterium]